MMYRMKLVSTVCIMVLSLLLLPLSATANPMNPPNDQPTVSIEALDLTSQPVEGAIVTIKRMGANSQIVYRGETDGNGKVDFVSILQENEWAETSNDVIDAVYELYIVYPNGQLQRTVFSATHYRHPILDASLKKLNNPLVQVKPTADAPTIDFSTQSTTISPQTIGWCDIIGGGWKACIADEMIILKKLK